MAKIVEVTKQGLESDIHNGLSRKEMATKYGISTITLASVLKQVGLSNKRGPQVIVKIVDIEEYNRQQDTIVTDNITEDNVTVEVLLKDAEGQYVSTVFYPGWNPELVIGIKAVPENTLQVGN